MPQAFPAVPPAVLAHVLRILGERGDRTAVRDVRRVKGGFEGASARLTTGQRMYFLKWNTMPGAAVFRAEAEHLALLASSGVVAVPEVLAAVDPPAGSGHEAGFLLQEWLSPPSRDAFLRRVGRELGATIARLHRVQALAACPIGGYGPARAAREASAWHEEWIAYYRDGLLRPQLEMAARDGRLSQTSRHGMDRLLARLEDYLGGVERQPSLIHGDLHRGNVLRNAAGTLVLIDPHPLFADRELELAYMDWVGGFSPAFSQGYEAWYPSAPGRPERRDLYLLLWRLQRLNGANAHDQGCAIDAIVRRYGRG